LVSFSPTTRRRRSGSGRIILILILIIHNHIMSSKLVKQSLKRAKEGRGTFASSSEQDKIRKHKLKKRKKSLKEKREKVKAEEQRKLELMGETVDEKALMARKRRHLAYFAIGLNDSGRVGELEKFLGKNGGKKKGQREDDDEDDDDAGDDWDVKDLFANAKKS